MLPTCRPLHSFLGPFGGARIPQNSMMKNIFMLLWTISLTRMGLLIWSGDYFQTKTLGHTCRPLVGLCVPSLFTPASKFIHPCIKVYSALRQSLFTPASKFIHPCIKVYSPLHQSLFTTSLKFIQPCIKIYSPLHQSSFTLAPKFIHPLMYPKWNKKAREWAGGMAQCLSL
jgi:hypothetical protein